eukprot:5295622-Amphidinium_carterae.2
MMFVAAHDAKTPKGGAHTQDELVIHTSNLLEANQETQIVQMANEDASQWVHITIVGHMGHQPRNIHHRRGLP